MLVNLKKINESLSSMDNAISTLMTNHFPHLEGDIKSIAKGVKDVDKKVDGLHAKVDTNTKATTENKTNIGWTMKLVMLIIASIVTGFIGTIFVLIRG